MNGVCISRQLLLHVQCLGQALHLIQLILSSVINTVHVVFLAHGKIHAAASLADVLDQVESVVPGGVGKFAEDTLEADPVLLVVGEVGGHQKVLKRTGYVGVGVLLQVGQQGVYRPVTGVAVLDGARSLTRNERRIM